MPPGILSVFLTIGPTLADQGRESQPSPTYQIRCALSLLMEASCRSIWPPWDCTQCYRLSWLYSHKHAQTVRAGLPRKPQHLPSGTLHLSSLLRWPGHFAQWTSLVLLAPLSSSDQLGTSLPMTSQPYATSAERCSVPVSQVTHCGAPGFPHIDCSAYQAEDSFLLGYPVTELDFQGHPVEGRKHTSEILLSSHLYPAMCSFHLGPALTGSVTADSDLQLGRI